MSQINYVPFHIHACLTPQDFPLNVYAHENLGMLYIHNSHHLQIITHPDNFAANACIQVNLAVDKEGAVLHKQILFCAPLLAILASIVAKPEYWPAAEGR